MKGNFWVVLLAFSLALNLGGLVTYAYMCYQDLGFWREPAQQQRFDRMWGPLKLEPKQKQAVQNLLPEHRRRVRGLREGLTQKRWELFEMINEGAAAWPAMQAKIKEVSALQGNLEEEILRFCLAFQEHLKPEQRTSFITFIERRMTNMQGGKYRQSPHWKSGMRPGTPQAAKPCEP